MLVSCVCVRCTRLLDRGTIAEVCAADTLQRRATRIICSKAAVNTYRVLHDLFLGHLTYNQKRKNPRKTREKIRKTKDCTGKRL